VGDIKNLSGPIEWNIDFKSYGFNLKEIEPFLNAWRKKKFVEVSGVTKLDKMKISGVSKDIKISGKVSIEEGRANFLKSRIKIDKMDGEIIFNNYDFNLWQFILDGLGINSLISGKITLGKNPKLKLETESKINLDMFSKIFVEELKKRNLKLKGNFESNLNISGNINDIKVDVKGNDKDSDIRWYNSIKKTKDLNLDIKAKLNYKNNILYVEKGRGKVNKYRLDFKGVFPFPPQQGKIFDIIFNDFTLDNQIGKIVIPLEEANAKGKINGKIATFWDKDKDDENFLKGDLNLKNVCLDNDFIKLESNGKLNFNRKKIWGKDMYINGVKSPSFSGDFIINGQTGLKNVKLAIGSKEVKGHIFRELVKNEPQWNTNFILNKIDITKFYPLMGSWKNIIEGPVSGEINLKIPSKDWTLTKGNAKLFIGPGKISKLKFLDEFAVKEKNASLGAIKFANFNIKGEVKKRMIEVKKTGFSFQGEKININAYGKIKVEKDNTYEYKCSVESRLAEWYAYKMPNLKRGTTILNLKDKTDNRIVLLLHIQGTEKSHSVKWDVGKQLAAKKYSLPSNIKEFIENRVKIMFYELIKK
jgi:hypothetical protein